MTRFNLFAFGALCWLASMSVAARGEDKIINITGDGTDAQYIESGKNKQLNVLAKVGDTVKWVNNGDRKHTATSGLNVGGKPLFDTGDIDKGGGQSPLLKVSQEFYDAAVKATGANPGDRVYLGYICLKHPTQMGGILVVQPQGFKLRKKEDH